MTLFNYLFSYLLVPPSTPRRMKAPWGLFLTVHGVSTEPQTAWHRVTPRRLMLNELGRCLWSIYIYMCIHIKKKKKKDWEHTAQKTSLDAEILDGSQFPDSAYFHFVQWQMCYFRNNENTVVLLYFLEKVTKKMLLGHSWIETRPQDARNGRDLRGWWGGEAQPGEMAAGLCNRIRKTLVCCS